MTLILNLILELHFRSVRLSQRICVGRACLWNIVLLEEDSSSPVARSRERFAARIVTWNPLQVAKCAITVAARKLELRQPQQCILGLRLKRIVNHYVLVVALCIGGIRRERRAPEQSLRV